MEQRDKIRAGLTRPSREVEDLAMKMRAPIVVFLVSIAVSMPGIGRSQNKEQLGTVNFSNSCSASVQETFQRGVAMLHSFRYGEGEKTLREVLAQDPSCAIATWGIAAILMSNPLAGVGPSKEWAARYPTDDEAQIFYALYLAATQSLADQTYRTYLTAADILEKQFAKHPDHPGVAHYLIHSYDAAPIAPKGVPAARRYASIAPAA